MPDVAVLYKQGVSSRGWRSEQYRTVLKSRVLCVSISVDRCVQCYFKIQSMFTQQFLCGSSDIYFTNLDPNHPFVVVHIVFALFVAVCFAVLASCALLGDIPGTHSSDKMAVDYIVHVE